MRRGGGVDGVGRGGKGSWHEGIEEVDNRGVREKRRGEASGRGG